MESEDAFRLRRTQELELEELSRLSLRHIVRCQIETKALVVRWIAAYGLESTAYGPQSAPTSPLLDIMFLLGRKKGL